MKQLLKTMKSQHSIKRTLTHQDLITFFYTYFLFSM